MLRRTLLMVLAVIPLAAACQSGGSPATTPVSAPTETTAAYTAGFAYSSEWVSADVAIEGHKPGAFVVAEVRRLCTKGGNDFDPASRRYKNEVGGIDQWIAGCVGGAVAAYTAAGVAEAADGGGPEPTSSTSGNTELFLRDLKSAAGWGGQGTDDAVLAEAGRAICELLAQGATAPQINNQMVEAGIFARQTPFLWNSAVTNLCPGAATPVSAP